jgi:FtsP/CotA-like multicopper oxidase with cupredoxin domain
MDRREFIATIGTAAACWAAPEPKADIALRISPVEIEIAPRRTIKTIGYNGSVPGPVLRLREGQSVTVEVQNDTPTPEIVHWHGLFIPSEADGSEEEGTPMVPAHGSRRYTFVPRPSGTRWYHTHVSAGRNLKRATYTGQFGFLYVEPKTEPGRYDTEVFLALHGWDPYLGTMASDGGADEGTLDVIYQSFSVNSHSLGFGEPVRVKEGQKIMLRILNASATMVHRLAFTGHKFEVVALDGNPVPTPRAVDVLELGPAERVDALVTMSQPGVWILGEVDGRVRSAGLGVVVEYAERKGPAQWAAPSAAGWDYTVFGQPGDMRKRDVELVPLVFRQKFAGNRWVDHWTINGKSFPKTDPIQVQANKRYRLRFDNQSGESHPVHLHRHSFELTQFAGIPTSGVVKDVVMVPAHRQVEVDFLADNPGPTLLHCHMQLHMDYGFMTMLQYAQYA